VDGRFGAGWASDCCIGAYKGEPGKSCHTLGVPLILCALHLFLPSVCIAMAQTTTTVSVPVKQNVGSVDYLANCAADPVSESHEVQNALPVLSEGSTGAVSQIRISDADSVPGSSSESQS
jgi:hypothetical protein